MGCDDFELQTFRVQDLSFLGTKGPYGKQSFIGPFVPGNFRSRDLSFMGSLVADNIHVCKLTALYTANAYSAGRGRNVSECLYSLYVPAMGQK